MSRVFRVINCFIGYHSKRKVKQNIEIKKTIINDVSIEEVIRRYEKACS